MSDAAATALNLKIKTQQFELQEMFSFRENLCTAAGGLNSTGKLTEAQEQK